ncbi:hypothetical protein BTR23_21035 [Alkalihalophilus pseudofirmus]|nr:hypothetical protein BTR23_21035 [Alkalihalophilus pseudofirmus]
MNKLPNSDGKTTQDDSREERPHSTPRWVKVFGIIAIVLVLLVVIIMVISGGEHGPGRHLSEGEYTEQSGQGVRGDSMPTGMSLQ